jgi:tRNA pseudouridine38-40 synthase
MRRILLTVEYDGTAYAGWQRQINGLAVQQVLEEALAGACGHPVTVTGSSRTDAGVHALDQKVHFDTGSGIPPEKYPFVLNTMLPPDIRVLEGREVPPDFHARFLTSGKTYTYRIWNARHGSALRRNTFWHIPVPLDEGTVRKALPSLYGRHDFAAFQAAGGTAKTTIRTIREAGLSVDGNEWILTVCGDAFLYNMVRIISGTLLEIGMGLREPEEMKEILEACDLSKAGPTAEAQGLTLIGITFS